MWVYCKSPFATPERVIECLGNYTHGVAISNKRIITLKDGEVSFKYKNYRAGNTSGVMKLHAIEFVKRFLRHILPRSFYKIRYFGILSQSNAKTKLEDCFSLLNLDTFLPVFEGLSTVEILKTLTGRKAICCPKCGKGRLVSVPILLY